MSDTETQFRFSLGPWCFDVGRDAFGPAVREEKTFEEVLKECRKMGYEGIELHDDDVVPGLNEVTHAELIQKAGEIGRKINDHGLEAAFIAPRLWEDPRTIDGAATANSPADRRYALERAKKAIDIANVLGTRNIVCFFGREGTYIREAKDPKDALDRVLDYVNGLLEYDRNIRILGETKPNEPMDLTCCPTAGHFIGLSYRTKDPARVGVAIESAHCVMANLDPADEFGYALWHDKLWLVHLDDQNGPKFNEHRTFGAINLRQALNQVMVLDRHGYGKNGEFVGIETRSLRTQDRERAADHLRNSRRIFLKLLEVSRGIRADVVERMRRERAYEELEMVVLDALIGLER